MSQIPAWAEWSPGAARSPWTVGVEEEIMLLDPADWSLASRADDVLPVLSPRVANTDFTAGPRHCLAAA